MQAMKLRKPVKKSSRTGLPPSETANAQHSPQAEESVDPKLNLLEVTIYFVLVVGLLSAAIYNVYISSQEHAEDFGPYILQPGWSLLGNQNKDVSDFEWSYWTAMVTPFVLLLLFGHISLGLVVEHAVPKFKKHFLLVYALTSLTSLFGLKALSVFLLYTLLTYLASRTKSAAVVWIIIGLEILSINWGSVSVYLRSLFPDEELYNHVVFGTALCLCRLLSFSLEYCRRVQQLRAAGAKQQEGTDEGWGLFDLLVYNFYLPLFASGPLLTYDKFSLQINQAPRLFTKAEVKKILKESCRYIFWTIFVEFVLHFLYFPAFHQVRLVFQFLPTWSIAGVGLCHLLFFQVKYLVTYGLPRAIALWDRIDAPLPPICVLAMYTFQDMWKYFDRGLHSLLVSTIYIPMGGSRHGFFRQLLASMLCFSFVFVWHGLETHLFYWALINWLGTVNEMVIQKVTHWLGVLPYLKSKLSSSMYCRLLGLILTPNFMALALSNLVFLGGIRTTNTYYYRLVQSDSPWPLFTTFITFYVILQVAKAAHQHFGKTYLCKKLYAS
ncbi:protein-cysteine N-palmitoyltransferase HHAT-like [Acanthaster planci]|uniref:Protein-cysteine N-palmitoyltransferase HHAT-like n=1 Tax=Acanthaster planci TaxID=133434 RepID=A0A8B7YFT1_ACAPL|nr:protein-cysteine N-palmitoyltransferase HHAT-like [Acanthaster planci]